MIQKKSHNSTFQSNNNGFALISTIIVMSLLLIVSLAMMSLSSISTRGASSKSNQAVAEAAARQALMVAIGELQRQLGPDQRISMIADQRTDSSGDGSETIAAVGNRYWTGVYNSWAPGSDTRPTPEFQS